MQPSGIICQMQRDYLGNPVSGSQEQTLTPIDDFIEGLLAYEKRAENIIAAADSDPDSCLANSYAGFLWMLLEAPEAAQHALRYLLAAERSAARASRREQLNAALLRAWVDGDVPRALLLCDQATDDCPRDLVMAKLHHYFEFNRGNAPEMLRVALKIGDAAADVPYVHGMAAFAFEQCHLLDEAERAAQRALHMRRKEPWAQHALAHVLLTRGHIDAGAAFLESSAETWTGLNSFMVTHLWWHLALYYLSQGRNAQALNLYDEHCWVEAKHYSQDQVGAVSLLSRFELAGIEVGERWSQLAHYLERRADDLVQPFLTMQYLYGLARARRPQADALMGAVRRHAAAAPAYARAVWQEVALPACEGLYAHAQGDYDRAWQRLAGVLPRLGEIGGSHAQRDLFEQLWLDSALKSARWAAAQQILELRRKGDPNGVPVNQALAEVYHQLNLPEQSARSRSRAEETRVRHAR